MGHPDPSTWTIKFLRLWALFVFQGLDIFLFRCVETQNFHEATVCLGFELPEKQF